MGRDRRHRACRKGSGNIFIATYPLTQVDTQISTRFAKEIACKHSKEDCSTYDFFYTIRADSPIIGGPSAGAAIAVLTLAELEGLQIQKNTAITGTINSGGFIGPVGGVVEKIDVAANQGILRVLVPKGERITSLNGKNITDITQYGKKQKVTIHEVFELGEAASLIANRPYESVSGELQQDQNYVETMRSLAESLCDRSNEYQHVLNKNLPIDSRVQDALDIFKEGNVPDRICEAL